MNTRSLANTIRGKKLGILLRDARSARHKNLEECASAMNITADTLRAYELGESSPSLPEIELLAYALDIPIEHFWDQRGLLGDEDGKRTINSQQLVGIRHRMVGVQVRKARMQAQMDATALAEAAGISVGKLNAYEMGQAPIPLPELEALAAALNLSVREFLDRSGPVGGWFVQQRAVKSFRELSPELQAFITKPVNRPYIELAQRLSEMDVDKLRTVAEGLLEITL